MSSPSDRSPKTRAMHLTVESLWKVYDIVQDQIKFADTKAGVILAGDGIVLSTILSILIEHSGAVPLPSPLAIELILATFAAFLSACCAVSCLLPRFRAGQPVSLIFFEHIAMKYATAGDYLTEARATWSRHNTAIEEIGYLIWATSRIAQRKHRWVIRAVWCLGASLLVSMVSLVSLVL